MSVRATKSPDWDQLYQTAAGQEGFVTSAQAAEAGYYPQLLRKHLLGGRLVRVRRGVYRLVHFPSGEHEDLVAAWLWTEQKGTFSHETALELQGLSDVLPAVAHITVPPDWEHRRLRVPEGVVLHYGDVPGAERTWVGSVPVTKVQRTLNDCMTGDVAPDLLQQAVQQATARGLIGEKEKRGVEGHLRRFLARSPERKSRLSKTGGRGKRP